MEVEIIKTKVVLYNKIEIIAKDDTLNKRYVWVEDTNMSPELAKQDARNKIGRNVKLNPTAFSYYKLNKN